MKKILLPVIFYLLPFTCLAAIPEGYYSSIDGKTGDAICEALFKKISSHHDVDYNGLWAVYPESDVIPGTNQVWDIYSNCSFQHAKSDQCGNYSNVCSCYNREHTLPKSWFGGEVRPMYSDAFHVMPTDGKVNGQRNNFPYGECSNGKTLSDKALGRLGSSTFTGYTSVGTVFEPIDEYKGDVARNYFYMVTCYRDKNFTQDKEGYGTKMFTWSNSKAGFTAYTIALMLKWHRQDPVSQKEIDRNNAIYDHQENRNPFIDYPCLAEYIWGDYQTKQLNLTDIMSSEDEKFLDPEYNSGCNCKTDNPTILYPTQSTTIAIGSASVNESVSKDILVQGVNLTQSLSCTISGTNAKYFSLAKSTITVTEALKGYNLTITYRPEATTSTTPHTATLTISSSELKSACTITLTGESKAELISPAKGDTYLLSAEGVGSSTSVDVLVKGTNLTKDVYVNISSSAPKSFSCTPTQLTAAQVKAGSLVTITYTPTAIGEESTVLIVRPLDGSEFAQLSLSVTGRCYFSLLDPTNITTNSATLNWTNAGKKNYMVDVFFLKQEKQDSVVILDSRKGSGATTDKAQVYPNEDTTAIRLGNSSSGGSLTYENLNMSAGCTVSVWAKAYKEDASALQITVDTIKRKVALTTAYAMYSVVVPEGASSKSTLQIASVAAGTGTKKRAYVQRVLALTGGTKEVREHVQGYPRSENYLFHTVSGLLPDTEYSYTITPDGLPESEIATFTTASTPTFVDSNHQSPITNHQSFMMNGHLYLRHNGQLYNILGQPSHP